jgi:two-component system sensor histidine kinase ChvG
MPGRPPRLTKLPGRAPRLRRTLRLTLSLRGKVLWMALLVIFVPLIVVWAMGGYEKVVRHRISRELDATARTLRRESSRRSLTIATLPRHRRWLQRFAARHHLMVLVVDGRGRPVRAARGARGVPEGPGAPDSPGTSDYFGLTPHAALLDHEASLPPVGERTEVVQALAGEVASTWRYTEDRRLAVCYQAVPIVRGGGVLYSMRVSWRNVRALYDYRFALLRLTLVLAGGVVVMALWVGLRLAKPISKIQQAIRAHLDHPAEVSPDTIQLESADEIGMLSRDVRSLAHAMQTQHRQAVGLAAELAHDLKNPIATVTASAEMLEAQSSQPGDRQARLAEALARAGEHMNRSVDGLLQLARLDHDLATQRRARVDLSRLVHTVVDEYRADPRTSEVALSGAIAPGVQVIGIEQHLGRLLRNLVDNALLFCHKAVKVTLRQEGDQARLEVEDDGPGIAEGNRDKLFRHFFTARPEHLPAGTGLGLAAVRAIATAHQGEVEAEPHGDLGGARLAVTLPASGAR